MQVRALLFFVLSVLVAYSADIVPWAAVALSDSGEGRFIGKLRNFAEPCTSIENSNPHCRVVYKIPLKVTDDMSGQLGLGYILTSATAYCSGNPSKKVSTGDVGGQRDVLESYKIYKFLELEALNCNKEGHLIIEVHNPSTQISSGQFGSMAILGSKSLVQVIKRSVEYLGSTAYATLAIFLILIFCIQNFVFTSLGANRDVVATRRFMVIVSAWAIFALFKSGIVEIVVPALTQKNTQFRIQCYASLVAHAVTIMHYTKFKSGVSETIRHPLLWILLGLPTLILDHYVGYIVITGGIALVCGLILQGKIWSSASGVHVAVLVELLKIFQVPGLPFGSVSLTIATLYASTEFIHNLKTLAKRGNLLYWTNDLYERLEQKSTLDLIRSFSHLAQISRVSIFELDREGGGRLTGIDLVSGSEKSTELFLESVPPVMAQVLASGQALLNTDVNTNVASAVLRRSPIKDLGRYFSIVPLLDEGIPVAVLALSGYSDKFAEDEEYLSDLKLMIASFERAILRKIVLSGRLSLAGFDEQCSKIAAEITKVSVDLCDRTTFIKYLLGSIERGLSANSFYATFYPDTRKLSIDVVNLESGTDFTSLVESDWIISESNVQGPAAIAINTRKAVAVPDVKWIKEIISNRTREYFDASGANSLAVLPISSEDRPEPTGLLWLQSRDVGAFYSAKAASLMKIQRAFEAGLREISHRAVIDGVLVGVVRSDIRDKLRRNQSYSESGFGYILQIDLRKSTSISIRLGEVMWKAFIGKLTNWAQENSNPAGFQVEMVVWDAFYFTATEGGADTVAEARELSDKFAEFIKDELRSHDIAVVDFESTVRACLDKGDITRRFEGGQWLITGSAIAKVTKMETICKNCAGSFFASSSALGVLSDVGLDTGMLHPVSNERIYEFGQERRNRNAA